MPSWNDDDLLRRARQSNGYKGGYVNRHSLVSGMKEDLALFNTADKPDAIMAALAHMIGSLIRAYEELTDVECLVQGCENKRSQGEFVGDICKPCHTFITRSEGTNNQVYKNAVKSAYERLIGD